MTPKQKPGEPELRAWSIITILNYNKMKNLNLLHRETRGYDLKNVVKVDLYPFDDDVQFVCTGTQIYVQGKMLDFEDPVVDFEFVTTLNALCVGTANGSVFMIQGEKREEVTFCADGIEAMRWSPDSDVVVFVTKTNNLVVMNCEFDVLNESSLLEAAFGEKEFMTVGWGKKETQFQGTEGKRAALEALKEQERILLTSIESNYERSVVTWREDGEHFAVLFTSAKNGRMFKVYSKDGLLQYTSEKCVGLGATFSWRPSGNWIAVPQVLPNKYTVALFEKNGLRHRELVLPFSSTDQQVIDLSWSNDSEILLVQTVSNGKSIIYLYTISNYFWYQKQTLIFDEKIITSKWDPNPSKRKTLHVFTSNGKHFIYAWDTAIHSSRGNTVDDEALVAVIDGKNLHLTALRNTIVPPPMSNFKLTLENPINFVVFGDTNDFLVVDCLNAIHTFRSAFTSTAVRRLCGAEPLQKYTFKVNDEYPLGLYHFQWISANVICFTGEKNIFTGKLAEDLEVEVGDGIEEKVGCLVADADRIIWQTLDGVVVEKQTEKKELYKIPETCTKIFTRDNHVILQKQNNIYVNGTKAVDNATSLHLVDKWLMYTTNTSELKFLDLTTKKELYCRKVERGSQIVKVVPESSRVILQMPRGNLECINPRFLSLNIISNLLTQQKYHQAFDILLKERINLNLLVDHDPTIILENAKSFIENIQNVQWLNLFVSELQNVDVTQTMYASNYPPRTGYNVSQKINVVCDRFIELLKDDGRYTLTLITCFVKKCDLEQALQVIWNLKLAGEDDRPVPVSADEAFKYLLYLVDVNQLYNIALGMYDFALVLFVAKRSQKDPKEYVPFLQELETLETNYCKFKIDCHLKRFSKAVVHISACEGEQRLEEGMKIIKEHKLYAEAMKAYDGSENYKAIALVYGNYLREKSKLLEASVMYERGGDHQSAINCARNCLDWKRCLTLLKRNSVGEMEIANFCEKLIPALQEADNHVDAAYIAKTILNNSELYIRICLNGNLYSDAILENGDPAVVKEHLSNYLSSRIRTMTGELETYKSQTGRLTAIRVEKERRKIEGSGDEEDMDSDMFSDTSSMDSSRYSGSSRGTGKTFRSSKNRRKHERKLLNLKEGNKFEDIAIIDSLFKLVTKTFAVAEQKQIRSILMVAVEMNLENLAKELQILYENFLVLIKESLDTIWIKEMIVPDEVVIDENIDFHKFQSSQHYALIKPQQRFKPSIERIEWELEVLK